MTEQVSRIIADAAEYWNDFAEDYSRDARISTDDFHYGPLLPGDSSLKLLPGDVSGLRCLELGCGGAQNSVYLARKGAECFALDVASEQISIARKLCTLKKVNVELKTVPMEQAETAFEGNFDLIHSTYGLCFSPMPEKVIMAVAKLLKPGGIFIFSLPHPLSAGEPLELDEDYGVFIANGYNPPPDCRGDEDDNEVVRSYYHTLSDISSWLDEAGMVIRRIVEPRLADPSSSAPFQCEQWEEYRALFEHIPGTLIIKAVRF